MTSLPTISLAAVGRLALRQHGLVTRAQAAEAGCTDERLDALCRDGVLVRLHRGVFRFASSPSTIEQRALAACLASGGIACQLTAVSLYGFDLGCAGVSERRPPDILYRFGTQRPGTGGYVTHRSRRLTDEEIVRRRGVPVTSPVRTMRDVAPLLPAPIVDRLLGHLLSTRELDPSDLSALQAAARGRGGTVALRHAVERAGVTTAPDSVLEHRALLLLRAAGLPDPVAQFPVHAGGRLLGIIDFAWPDVAVALEVDGFRWHSDPRRFAGDRRRDNVMHELGWTIYRTTFDELSKGAGALLRQLGRELAGPPSTGDAGGARWASRSTG